MPHTLNEENPILEMETDKPDHFDNYIEDFIYRNICYFIYEDQNGYYLKDFEDNRSPFSYHGIVSWKREKALEEKTKYFEMFYKKYSPIQLHERCIELLGQNDGLNIEISNISKWQICQPGQKENQIKKRKEKIENNKFEYCFLIKLLYDKSH